MKSYVRIQNLNVCSYNEPWCDKNCHEAKVYKYSLLRKFRLTNSDKDHNNYLEAKGKFKRICKSKKEEYNRCKRQLLPQSIEIIQLNFGKY